MIKQVNEKVNLDEFEWFPKPRDLQKDIESYKEYTRSEQKKALEYWMLEIKAKRERVEKSKELLEDALGCMIMFTGVDNEHVKRIAEGIRSIYPRSEENK